MELPTISIESTTNRNPAFKEGKQDIFLISRLTLAYNPQIEHQCLKRRHINAMQLSMYANAEENHFETHLKNHLEKQFGKPFGKAHGDGNLPTVKGIRTYALIPTVTP